MLSQKEKHQLKQYCDENPQLSILVQHLEDSHRMHLSQISHEIRNPVTIINSFLQLTQKTYPEVSNFDTWKPILENMEYLKQLLAEFSEYNNSNQLHKEILALHPFLEKLIFECQTTLPMVTFSYQKTTAIPLAAFDKTKLQSAILNIVRNAYEAMETQNNKQICISLSFRKDFFFIKIANNGPMIPSERLPHLFEPFATYKKNGSGLGLAIVRNVILAHNGSIAVHSTTKETSFTIKLPLQYN